MWEAIYTCICNRLAISCQCTYKGCFPLKLVKAGLHWHLHMYLHCFYETASLITSLRSHYKGKCLSLNAMRDPYKFDSYKYNTKTYGYFFFFLLSFIRLASLSLLVVFVDIWQGSHFSCDTKFHLFSRLFTGKSNEIQGQFGFESVFVLII